MARPSSRSVGESRFEGLRNSIADAFARLDPVAFLLASWWLALVAIAVLQQAHAGIHERHELAPVLHVLRDGALAVPVAALAVAAATLVVAGRDGTAAPRSRHSLGVDRLMWVIVGATTFALLCVPGHQLHGVLFGAEAEELSFLADTALDSGIAFLGAILALGPVAVVAGPPLRHSTRQASPQTPARPDRSGQVRAPARSTR